eukprot:scaffold5364_cov156-Skeletonema_menzelii.AAC.9
MKSNCFSPNRLSFSRYDTYLDTSMHVRYVGTPRKGPQEEGFDCLSRSFNASNAQLNGSIACRYIIPTCATIGRFKIKKKSRPRCETPTFVTDAVNAAVEIATEQIIIERIKAAQETIDFGGSEDNSLVECEPDQPAEDVEEDAEEDAEEGAEEDAMVEELTADFLKYSCREVPDEKSCAPQHAPQRRYIQMGRFKIKKKSRPRCETPTFVTDAVAEAVDVECEPAEPALEENAKDDTDDAKEDEHKSDFRKWVECRDNDTEVKPTKPKTAQEILGNMWLDFVEAKVMPSVFCSTACGDFDDDSTAASSADTEHDLAAYALTSTPRPLSSPRRRTSKPQKRKSSRNPHRTRHD